MAVFKSDQFTNFFSAVPKVAFKPSDYAGRVRVARATYTAPASGMPAAADTINMIVIPWNARVLAVFLNSDAQAAGAIAQIGDGVTATRWGTSTALTAASQQVLQPTTADATTALPTSYTASAVAGVPTGYLPVIITMNTAGIAASAKLALTVLYAVD